MTGRSEFFGHKSEVLTLEGEVLQTAVAAISYHQRRFRTARVHRQAVRTGGAARAFAIYDDAPGGHSFERIDTTFARNVRDDMYAFLAMHLK